MLFGTATGDSTSRQPRVEAKAFISDPSSRPPTVTTLPLIILYFNPESRTQRPSMSLLQQDKKLQDSKDAQKDNPIALPPSSSSPFPFTAPFSESSSSQATIKQRRVSLALPSSPKVCSAWSFRDDTAVDKSVASTSSTPASEKKGKMRRVTADDKPLDKALPQPEKRQRKKWTEEETQMLVTGCNTVCLRVSFFPLSRSRHRHRH